MPRVEVSSLMKRRTTPVILSAAKDLSADPTLRSSLPSVVGMLVHRIFTPGLNLIDLPLLSSVPSSLVAYCSSLELFSCWDDRGQTLFHKWLGSARREARPPRAYPGYCRGL